MGCTNTKVQSARSGPLSLEGIDLLAPESRKVNEFPFYSTRLQTVDYNSIIAKGENWTDPQFPPDKSSLLDGSMMKKKRHESWQGLVWKRPEEVYGDGNFVLYNTIGPNDIKQGKCGDCYFLSSISSLAEYSDRVERIFITKKVN